MIVQAPDGITFDQTVDAGPDSPAAAEAIADATTSTTDDGLRVTRTETSPPARTLASSTETEVITPDREETSGQVELTIGPGTTQVGPDRAETLIVPNGSTNINTNLRTTKYVNVATKTTNTYLTTATITISAVGPASTTTTSLAATTSTGPGSGVPPSSTDAPRGELARTGSSNGPWTALGITLVLAGAGFLHLSRRMSTTEGIR